MFEHETLVSFVFRWLNFGILVGLGVYFFKRYGLLAIKERMATHDELLNQLQHRKEALKGNQRALERQSEEQELLCTQLGAKIERWYTVVEQRAQQQRMEQEQQQEKIVKRVALQTDYKQKKHAYKQVMPQVLQQATAQLQDQFASEQTGQQFIVRLIEDMERRKA